MREYVRNIEVACGHNKVELTRLTVDGWESGIPGLVITPSLGNHSDLFFDPSDLSGFKPQPDSWTVTHQPTGWAARIGPYPTVQEACKAATDVDDQWEHPDWLSLVSTEAVSEMARKVRGSEA